MDSSRQSLGRFIGELRARKVTRVAITYIAVAFAGLQGMDLVLAPLGAAGAYRWVVIAVLAGFPVALVLAWFFDVRRSRSANATSSDAAPAARPHRSFGKRRVAVVAALVIVGLGLYGYGRTAHGGEVAAGAEVIAVAPFTAVGGEVSALGEGMPQLLSANLDQVGGLRTLDPARVLRAWEEGGAGRRTDDEALALGRRLGAGSVLLGSVVAAGNEVRLAGVLRGVDGQEIARAQVTGPASDVLALADGLSNQLLRAIWRSRSPIPQLRIAAITTSNLDAIRAYLAGERFYRTLQYDSAIAALRRAIELDSTFALAHRRLAGAYGWSSNYDTPLRQEEVAAAVRDPERLPERERTLALADALYERDEYQAALDSVDSHLRRYPDDAEALMLRGETLTHGRSAGVFPGETDSTLIAAFEAALRVDPDYLPAMIHPFGLSAVMGDSARFRRYGSRVLGSRTDKAAVPFLVDSAIDVLWNRNPASGRFLRRFLTDDMFREIRWEASPLATLINNRRDPNAAADALATMRLDDVDKLSVFLVSASLVGIGRLTDADRVLRQLQARMPTRVMHLRFTAVGIGLAGSDFAPKLWPRAEFPLPAGAKQEWLAPLQAAEDLGHGDTAAAASALAAAAREAGRLPPELEATRRYEAARLEVLRGRPAEGLRAMETALAAIEAAPLVEWAPPPGFHRLFLAIAHAQYAPTRKRGIAELRAFEETVPLTPLVRMHLARALEAEGQREAAIEEYGIFAMQTRRAEGPVARMNEEAKAALARLTRER